MPVGKLPILHVGKALGRSREWYKFPANGVKNNFLLIVNDFRGLKDKEK
jgi:hypothetical protein